MLEGSKAHIPPDIVFALGTQLKCKLDKQHETDISNANLTRKLPNATIFHRLALGFVLVQIIVWFVRTHVGMVWTCVGSTRVMGYHHIKLSNYPYH